MEPYLPSRLPLEIDWETHISQSLEAGIALGEYKGVLRGIINPYLFLAPLNLREAVISSRIEGTQTTVEEVMRFGIEEGQIVQSDSQKNSQEVVNYCNAMNAGVNLLSKKPMCVNTLCEIHRVLLTSVRGEEKNPGEIRRTQNWIGPDGCTQDEAIFVPPDPMVVKEYLYNWEDYIHIQERNIFVQLAIIKAQFELIHPFRDGNGRIGRMLVPLILYNKGLLPSPTFYISAYLQKNDKVYRERLLAISQESDWSGWISFFLHAMLEQAKENNERADALMKLYKDLKQIIPNLLDSKYSSYIIDAMFSFPMFNSNIFIKSIEDSGIVIPKDTVTWILRKLRENEIISVYSEASGRRGAIYVFPKLMELTK